MKVLCEPLPQARRHFTRFDQVEQLVRASEADPDLGFMGRLMALCSLPRTNPGRTLQYKRVNGPYTLIMTAVGQTGLPFGNLPRLLLVWVSTEAVRTRSRELFLGTSLSEFMCKLGLAPVGGGANGARTRLRNQMRRLFHCQVELIHEDARGERFIASRIADRGELLWNKRKPNEPSLWESKLRLGEEFFNEIIHCPFPLNMNIFPGDQALFFGTGSVPVAHLSNLHTEGPIMDFLGAALPAVRSGSGQGQRPRQDR